MKTIRILLLLLSLCSSGLAHSYAPAAGLWWNPNESGRGYTIDIQQNVMIVTAYVYSNGGTATWFVAAGTYNNTEATLSANLISETGGQCLGCPYIAPTGTVGGPLTITFTSTETGVMNFPGGSTQIQHELYGYNSKTDYFLGEWAFSSGSAAGGSALIDTQWVIFNGHFTGSDGTVYASGGIDSVPSSSALGAYDASTKLFIVAIDDNVGFTDEYEFPLGDDRRMLGLGAVFLTSGSPLNPTLVSTGSRILFQGETLASASSPQVESPASEFQSDDRKLHQLAGTIETRLLKLRALIPETK